MTHVLNAHDDGDAVVVEGCRAPRLNVAFGDEELGEPVRPMLHRWRIDLAAGRVTEEALDDRAGDFPRLNDDHAGLPARYGYVANPRSWGETKVAFEGVVKHDLVAGTSVVHSYGPTVLAGEAAFAPDPDRSTEDGGWLLNFVYDEAGVSGLATPGTAMPGTAGSLAALVAGLAAPGAADAALSLLSSLMFLDSSSARAAASLACLRWASCSSVDFLPWTAPLDSVSLSGAVLLARWSSTWVCTLPVAARPEAATSAVGAEPASLRRNSLKSRLCAARILRASPFGVALASAEPGNCRTAPALRRLTLPWIKASGLARSRATSIWSSDTSAGRWALAMRPAVSPAFTVTLSPGVGAAAAGVGRATTGVRGAGAGRACSGVGIWACAVGAAGARRKAGGSNSMV